jgi:hypothetical protein
MECSEISQIQAVSLYGETVSDLPLNSTFAMDNFEISNVSISQVESPNEETVSDLQPNGTFPMEYPDSSNISFSHQIQAKSPNNETVSDLRQYSTFPLGFPDSPNVSFFQQIQAESPNYVKLSPSQCISAYSTAILFTRRNLILITSHSSTVNGSLLGYNPYYDAGMTDSIESYSWICNSTFKNHGIPCVDVISNVTAAAADWTSMNIRPKVERCLSERISGTCSLQFSFLIMLVVIVCNLAKTVVMAVTAFKLVWSPLVTIGDGIASFVADPDEYTKGFCLLTAKKIKQVEWQADPRDSSSIHISWKVEKLRWAQSASVRRWILCNALYVHISDFTYSEADC